MTNAEFWASRWEAEQAAFRKVLAALPGDKLEYAPHERCTNAGNLAWQLVQEQYGIADLLRDRKNEFAMSKCPGHDEVLAEWDKATEVVREALKSAPADSEWEGEAKFLMGGAPVWTDTLRNMLWGFLFDMVHHRGQLSSYLRPMGGKVPAIYGPSGDSEH
jgi:uncharacterized damage-inducible protein DinB